MIGAYLEKDYFYQIFSFIKILCLLQKHNIKDLKIYIKKLKMLQNY